MAPPVCPSGPRENDALKTLARALHVHCTCTMHPSPLLHTAPSWPCPGAPMYRVWCRWLKVHFHRRTPRQNSFFAPGACSWYPTGTAPPMDFKLVQYACDLRVWVQELSPFDLQGRAEIFGRPSRGGTCHVPCAAGRPATGTNVVPALRITNTIELRSLNSFSVPNLVSIAQSFLKPEDPSRINLSGPGARTLHRTRTVTTKTYGLG